MAWFSGLAKNAESFLNNLDQSAADALNTEEEGIDRAGLQEPVKSSYQQHTRGSSYSQKSEPTVIPMITATGELQQSEISAAQQQPHSAPSSVITRSSTAAAVRPKHDDLLDFLNSSESPPMAQAATASRKKSPHSQGSSVDVPVGDQQQHRANVLGGSETGSSGYQTVAAGPSVDAPRVEPGPQVAPMTVPSLPPGGMLGGGSLDLENKMLRSEVSSLSQEVSTLLQRNHRSEEEAKRLRAQVDKVQNQLREADRRARENSSRCDDLEETVRVRDSQCAVLRGELSLTQQTGDQMRRELDALDSKHSEFVTDNSSSKEAQSFALEELRASLTKAENDLYQERDALLKVNVICDQLRRTVEDNKLKEVELLRRQASLGDDERRRQESTVAQLEVARQRNESLQKELRDYKDKATKILQMKEKVIASLKGEEVSSGASWTVGGGEDAGNPSRTELDSMREENLLLREEVQRCRVELERRDCDLQDLERESESQSESLRRNIDLLEEQLDREKQLCRDSESELSQLRREHQMTQERAQRQRTEMSEHIATKEAEIIRLRSMLTLKASQTESQAELEARVRNLTENVIQKQAFLDAVKAEKHSLHIKLERVQSDYESLERLHIGQMAGSDPVVRSGLSHVGGGGSAARDTAYLRINMQDPPLTKNVKTAVNSLDTLSMRLVSLIRRYPPARIFMLCYTILLHLWVFFVIFTYQPEIHSGSPPGADVPPKTVNKP